VIPKRCHHWRQIMPSVFVSRQAEAQPSTHGRQVAQSMEKVSTPPLLHSVIVMFVTNMAFIEFVCSVTWMLMDVQKHCSREAKWYSEGEAF
jgi:hypothetical protein